MARSRTLAAAHTGARAYATLGEVLADGDMDVVHSHCGHGHACGTPVIATTESPLPDLLTGGGIFVKPRDAQALLDAMRIMACDEGRRAAMGQAAFASASKL